MELGAQGRFTRGKETGHPFHRRLSGPHGRCGQVWKFSQSPRIHPRTAQALVSRYAD